MAVRITVRVKPRSRRDRVGGSWGGEGSLVIEVKAPATGGRANAAAEEALARALDVPRSSVSIVHGRRGRDKIIQVDDGPADLDDRVARLRAGR